jgi:uncharacterized lipoprotein YmbA
LSFRRSARGILVLAVIWSVAAFVASCASPPLTVYTMEPSVGGSDAALADKIKVLEVKRLAIPDAFDNQDIMVRHASTFARSSNGRWASRLSLNATFFLTCQIAQRRPDVLVTDQPQIEPPDYRLFVTINALDVTSNGAATLEADWLAVPRNLALPSFRQRGRFSVTGSAATDQDVVSLYTDLLRQLADAVAASSKW